MSKCDLVSPEVIAERIEKIKAFTRDSFLEKVPIIPVSAKTEEGIDWLKLALRELALVVKPRVDTGIFRLPIDRVFTLPRFGAIIAGTLLAGEGESR